MTYKTLSINKEDGVGIININVPPANSLSPELVKELDMAVDEMAKDSEVSVILFTSATKVFIAGADLKTVNQFIEAEDVEAFGDYILRLNNLLNRIEKLPKLTIAVINGHALGGGLELCLACDFRLMTDDKKAIIGLPEVKLGLLPGGGGTQRIGRLLGRAEAMDLIINAKNLNAVEALEKGIIHKIYPSSKLYEAALAEAKRLASGPVVAFAEIKNCLIEGLDKDLENGLLVERESILRLFETKDFKEGVSAFIEKRKAQFSGK